MREIKGLLADIEGIEIKLINNKVVVDGQILLPKDLNRVYSVVSQYPDMASSLVTLSPLAQKKIAEFIERDINNPEIHVRPVNEKFILEGVANDEAEKQRAEIIAKTYVPDTIVEAAEAGGVIKKRKLDVVIKRSRPLNAQGHGLRECSESPYSETIGAPVHGSVWLSAATMSCSTP